jgi:hypothetical protein
MVKSLKNSKNLPVRWAAAGFAVRLKRWLLARDPKADLDEIALLAGRRRLR